MSLYPSHYHQDRAAITCSPPAQAPYIGTLSAPQPPNLRFDSVDNQLQAGLAELMSHNARLEQVASRLGGAVPEKDEKSGGFASSIVVDRLANLAQLLENTINRTRGLVERLETL